MLNNSSCHSLIIVIRINNLVLCVRRNRARLDAFIYASAKKKSTQLTLAEEQRKIVWSFIYSKRLVLDPRELRAYGIPVYRFCQDPNDTAIDRGSMFIGVCLELIYQSMKSSISFLAIAYQQACLDWSTIVYGFNSMLANGKV